MEKNIKNIKKQFAQNGIYYTPKEDAERLKKLIDIEYSEVYDPTCGQGNLLAVFDDSIKKYGQELDEDELEKAKRILVNFEGYAGDTLTNDHFAERKFEVIIANPPFSVKWEQNQKDERFNKCALAPKSKADWAFNLHIIHHLKNDGQAVVLNFPGTAYRGNAEKQIREYFVKNNFIDKVIAYPPNTFVDTKIATIVYVFKKNKTNRKITFVDEYGNEKQVTHEEIEREDYSLSVSTYIQKENERQEVDINEINENLRNIYIQNLKKSIQLDFEIVKQVDKKEIVNHVKMIDEMLKALEEHTEKIRLMT